MNNYEPKSDFTKPLEDILYRHFGTASMAQKSFFCQTTKKEYSFFERTRSNVNLQAGRFYTQEDIDKLRDDFLSKSDKKLHKLKKIEKLLSR